MAKTISLTQHLHFLAEMKSGSGGQVRADQTSLEAAFGGGPIATGDMATRFRTIRLRLARTRRKSLPPRGIARFQRRGPSGVTRLRGLIRRTGRLAWGHLG
jgi:hypothetical protein